MPPATRTSTSRQASTTRRRLSSSCPTRARPPGVGGFTLSDLSRLSRRCNRCEGRRSRGHRGSPSATRLPIEAQTLPRATGSGGSLYLHAHAGAARRAGRSTRTRGCSRARRRRSATRRPTPTPPPPPTAAFDTGDVHDHGQPAAPHPGLGPPAVHLASQRRRFVETDRHFLGRRGRRDAHDLGQHRRISQTIRRRRINFSRGGLPLSRTQPADLQAAAGHRRPPDHDC